nr:chromodomain-helicase-DNA-binding protein 1-like [Aegilops tauschii subsp. strangulata]
MLTVAPYKTPEKKEKKKNPTRGAREGLRPLSPGTLTPLLCKRGDQEEEEEEEEESGSSRTRKRATPTEAEGENPSPAPKKRGKGKLVLLDDSSDSDEESAASERIPEKVPRVKPRTESPARDRPNDQISEGTSPPTDLAESGCASDAAPRPGSHEELKLVNKRLDEAQAGAPEVENLRAELRKVKAGAVKQKVAGERTTIELTLVKNDSEKQEARVAEVQHELKDAITKM